MFSNTLNKITGSKKSYKMEAKVFPSCEYIMNFDGASKGNPGLSGAGAVIYKNREEIWSSCKFVGIKTNNQSEYSALILGLKGALTLGITNLSVLGDSLLVINQVNGIYKVKSSSIFDLYEEVLALKSQFDFVEFNHVYRNYNKRADELSNLALDQPNDLQTEFIKELDEDWNIKDPVEEVRLEKTRIEDVKQILFVKIPSVNLKIPSVKLKIPSVKLKIPSVKTKTKDKQLSITQFFKIGSLFPDI
jgi:ribonuclease HI